MPNGAKGVHLFGASDTQVGGLTVGAGNVVSGNGSNGIELSGTGATSNLLQGNLVGANLSGATAVPNTGSGITVFEVTGNTIGGAAAGARNIISGNGYKGVELSGGAASNPVLGNYIGVQADGATPLPNASDGVYIDGPNNRIGGVLAGEANVIASNGGKGVLVAAGAGNAIRANSIHGNVGLGIDLGNDQVTPNDTDDADVGPNNLQNYPVLTSARTTGSVVKVDGSLNSAAGANFAVDFYVSPTCHPIGNGGGKLWLGPLDATTNGSGLAALNGSFTVAVSAGQVVTATATDAAGNTSEFSACIGLSPEPSPPPSGGGGGGGGSGGSFNNTPPPPPVPPLTPVFTGNGTVSVLGPSVVPPAVASRPPMGVP